MHKSRSLFGPVFVLLACWLVFPAASRADSVIFSNFGPQGAVYHLTLGSAGPFGAAYSTTGVPGDVAVPFTPSSDAELSQIILPLLLESIAGVPTPNDTTVELVDSVNGLPGPTVLESWSPIVLPFFTDSPPVTLTSAPSVFLASGTQYWIVVGTVGTDFWLSNDIGQINTFLLGHGTDWVSGAGLFEGPAYEVTGTAPAPPTTTPEPSSLPLLGIGLLAFAGLRLRKEPSGNVGLGCRAE
jgi:hypothetical protein